MRLVHTPSPPYRWDDVGYSYRETFPKGACVIAHGDIELVTRIGREQRWTPGAFCTVENFAWSRYAPLYRDYLLNRDYETLPFADLSRRQNFLFDTIGRDGRVFVRPNSPLKLFTGQIVTRATFSADLEFMSFYEFAPSSPVVVSSPKEIAAEWRFVVADRHVVAGALYRNGTELDYQPCSDGKARELAKRIASLDYQPDRVWVLDICKTLDNSYHLLEIGGFSFADLYACNMADVVAAVSATARAVWEESQCR